MLAFPDFEEQVDPKILQRGRTYYQEDAVQDVEELAGGLWKAIVYGTEPYRVQLRIKNNKVADWQCNCPYDFGPICKHVVALLFTLQEIKEAFGPDTEVKKNTTRQSTTDAAPGSFVKVMTPKQCREALHYACTHYPQLEAELKLKYAFAGKADKKTLAALIRQAVRSAQGRHGYIEWNRAQSLQSVFAGIDAKVQEALKRGDVRFVWEMMVGAVETLIPWLGRADDHEGQLGGYTEDCFALLEELLDGPLSPDFAAECFSYLMDAFEKRRGEEVGYHWYWLELAIPVVQSPGMEKRLLKALDRYPHEAEGDRSQDFEALRLLGFRLELYRRRRSTEEVARLLEAHLHFPSIRQEAVEEAFLQADYPRARRLCEDGIRQSRSERQPHQAVQWYEWLLRIAQQQQDADGQRDAAEYLLAEGSHSAVYYRLLRSLLPVKEWPAKRREYLACMKRKHDLPSVMEILVEEAQEEEMDALIAERESLELLLQYEKPLLQQFPAVVKKHFPPLVLKFMEQSKDRKQYRKVASFLIRLKKRLGKGAVAPIALLLKTLYANRPALQEELKDL